MPDHTFDTLEKMIFQGACLNEADAKAHTRTADHYDRLYSVFGIFIIVLTAATSASLLQAIGQTSSYWQKVVAAVLSALATAVAAVQTFLKAADKAKAHDQTAREYMALSGEQMGLLYELDLQETRHVTDSLRTKFLLSDQRRRKIEADAPRLSRRDQIWYEKEGKPDALLKTRMRSGDAPAPDGEAAP